MSKKLKLLSLCSLFLLFLQCKDNELVKDEPTTGEEQVDNGGDSGNNGESGNDTNGGGSGNNGESGNDTNGGDSGNNGESGNDAQLYKKVDFNNRNDVAEYKKEEVNKDFGDCIFINRPENAAIKDKSLRITYPKGKTGGIFCAVNIESSQEYTLSYKVFFEAGFDWKLGGKLPGLAGGSRPTGGNTDDATNGTGFSCRYMWKKNGEFIAYVYSKDMTGDYGTNVWAELNGERYKLPIGEWITITEYIKMNTGSEDNGVLRTWITDSTGKHEVISIDNMVWMSKNNRIDILYLDTFFGGGGSKYHPLRTSYAKFDDFTIYRGLKID